MKKNENSQTTYQQNPTNDNEKNKSDKKKKYLAFLKQQQQLERKRTKQLLISKQQQELKKNESKLKKQLKSKKKQLEQLKNKQKDQYSKQQRGYQLALIKQSNDLKKKQEKQQSIKNNQNKSNKRFGQALKWLENQIIQLNLKKEQAQYRRKVVQESFKHQRNNASKYVQSIKPQRKNSEPVISQKFINTNQILGRKAYQYQNQSSKQSKQRIKQMPILVQCQLTEQKANQRAVKVQEIRRAQSAKNKQNTERQLQLSKNRGNQVLLKMKRQKQLQQYNEDIQRKAITYNMNKVSAGIQDQFTGIKSATISQIQTNKNIRSELEFQKIFFSKNISTNYNKIATNYQINQARNIKSLHKQNKILNYKHNQNLNHDSLNVGQSIGKHSFQQKQNYQGYLDKQNNKNKNSKRQCQQTSIKKSKQIFNDSLNQLTPEIIKQYNNYKSSIKNKQHKENSSIKKQQKRGSKNISIPKNIQNNQLNVIYSDNNKQEINCQYSQQSQDSIN